MFVTFISLDMTIFISNLMLIYSYFDEIDRIAMPGYEPKEQDILRSRTPTAGIIEYKFDQEQFVFR